MTGTRTLVEDDGFEGKNGVLVVGSSFSDSEGDDGRKAGIVVYVAVSVVFDVGEDGMSGSGVSADIARESDVSYASVVRMICRNMIVVSSMSSRILDGWCAVSQINQEHNHRNGRCQIACTNA